MILAAILDAGWPLAELQDVVARLNLPGVCVSAARVQCSGLAAMRVQVALEPELQARHRHLPEILRLIERSGLSDLATQRAAAIFRRLADAEAAVHGIAPEQVHFHEVGAADAIVDIVGACAGIERLGLEDVSCSPIPTGRGTVTCAHGVLPVPAPATALLLKGVPLADCDEPGELTTPTGAAILTTLARRFGTIPAMRMAAIGCGAGSRVGRTRPNLLRLIVGDLASPPALPGDRVVVLEAEIDDAPGQILAYACERLLAGGALDAYLVPIIMKKGRPGQILTVVGRPEALAALEEIIFRETTTLGIRRRESLRSTLPREMVTVATCFGPVRVKVAGPAGGPRRAWPEYEDCAAAARQAGVALRDVQEEALRVWQRNDAGAQHDA
jgi:uncharacterized protein (TIGR00299 family) protein